MQVHLSNWLSAIAIVGLTDKAVDESRERVRAAECAQRLICLAENGPEAAWGGDIDILAAGSLTELLNHLRGT